MHWRDQFCVHARVTGIEYCACPCALYRRRRFPPGAPSCKASQSPLRSAASPALACTISKTPEEASCLNSTSGVSGATTVIGNSISVPLALSCVAHSAIPAYRTYGRCGGVKAICRPASAPAVYSQVAKGAAAKIYAELCISRLYKIAGAGASRRGNGPCRPNTVSFIIILPLCQVWAVLTLLYPRDIHLPLCRQLSCPQLMAQRLCCPWCGAFPGSIFSLPSSGNMAGSWSIQPSPRALCPVF